MSRNLDSSLAAALGNGLIQPVVLAQITLNSGVQNVWSGIGDLVWAGKIFSGVGYLGKVGPITEASAVQAEGTTVTLSGIGLSELDIPALGVTPPAPPFTPPPGQSVAWAIAASYPTGIGTFSVGPDVWNGGLGNSGVTSGNRSSGLLGLTNGNSLEQNSVGLQWSGYQLPPEIPLGATITGVYPVVNVGAISAGGDTEIRYTGGNFVLALGTQSGPNLGTLTGMSISASITNSIAGSANFEIILNFVGMAVYYEGSPLSKTPLIYEAMNDVRIGGAAKIWYGLWSNGAFIGTPYLAFSGTVDKPTVNTSASSTSITLALENRLINLQRANQRRYTAADQHLAYPSDLAFNWVELLNDMSLKEGTA